MSDLKRTITPNDPADFTPTREPQIPLQPFRYWCQKVLPLVYDDSLSYYELLCKVIDYLNKTMEDVTNLNTDMSSLYNAYDELQSYVNNYFSTLDVQKEIDNKLDEMASDGTLYNIIKQYTDPIINQQNQKIAVLESRMDTFTELPDGSTTGDAELHDIRVGYNGITYTSAGESVRTQVEELQSNINNIVTTNIIFSSDLLSVTGTGNYVNKTLEFPSQPNKKYTLSFSEVSGSKDVPYAFIRAFNNGSKIQTFSFEQNEKSKTITTPDNTNIIQIGFNGCTTSTFTETDSALFYDVLFIEGDEKSIKLNPDVDLSENNNIIDLSDKYNSLIDSNLSLYLKELEITGVGTFINKQYTFDCKANTEYTLKLDNVTGYKDIPYAFIRTLASDGSTISTHSFERGELSKTITTEQNATKIIAAFNACTYTSFTSYDKAIFYGIEFGEGSELYKRLDKSVTITDDNIDNNLKKENYELYKIFKAVGVCGDSLSVGHIGTSSRRNVDYSWPKYIERDSNSSWRCFGMSGATTLTWISDSFGYTLANTDGNKCQCYIIGLGVNDARTVPLGTPDDISSDTSQTKTTFYGAYAKIIYLLKGINKSAKIICLTNPRNDTGGQIDDFNNAIIYIATTHFKTTDNVFLLDMTEYSEEFNNDNYPIREDFELIGSHYSPVGYRLIANLNERAISKLIINNHENFLDVYTIPYDAGDGTTGTRE